MHFVSPCILYFQVLSLSKLVSPSFFPLFLHFVVIHFISSFPPPSLPHTHTQHKHALSFPSFYVIFNPAPDSLWGLNPILVWVLGCHGLGLSFPIPLQGRHTPFPKIIFSYHYNNLCYWAALVHWNSVCDKSINLPVTWNQNTSPVPTVKEHLNFNHSKTRWCSTHAAVVLIVSWELVLRPRSCQYSLLRSRTFLVQRKLHCEELYHLYSLPDVSLNL